MADEESNVMDKKDIESKIYCCETVIGCINNIRIPMLITQGEKDVVKDALMLYIQKLKEDLI